VDIVVQRSRILESVGYGDSFRKSDGGCWDISFHDGVGEDTLEDVLIPSFWPGDCGEEKYTYAGPTPEPPITDDAVDNAVYRLLNKVDVDADGVIEVVDDSFVIDDPDTQLEVEGEIGVQNLWGPLKVRLIVWD
jgi:hypothetical protein